MIRQLNTLILMIAVLITGGCMQKKDIETPKEGEIVTWKKNSQLVFKARLGQRREHLPDTHCTRCEAEFYNKEYDRYLGQFPIDYVPEKFAKLSPTEIEKMPIALSNNGAIEFSLMLNGATDGVTDWHHNDDENQVKVRVEGITHDMRADNTTTRSSFERMVVSRDRKYFIPETLFQKYGLTCYYNRPEGRRFRCFGSSSGEDVTGIQLLVPTEKAGFTENSYERLISADYYEPILGGLWIKWQTHPKNWDKWQQIDAAVWRLIKAWNVAPQSNETH